VVVALALALAVVAGACGDGGGPAADAGPTAISVSRYDGERLVGRRALDCGPAGRACAAVVALLPRLRPAPGEVCAQIYGGPGRLVVEGVVDGRPVAVEVTRTDGCGIDRFDRLEAALGGA
jgi:hypothetical protein